MRFFLVALFFISIAFGSGVPDQTQDNQDKDSKAAALNKAIAMMMMMKCLMKKKKQPPPPKPPIECILAPLAMMQAGKDKKHEGSAAATEGTASPGFGLENAEAPKKPTPKEKEELEESGSGLTLQEERDLEKMKSLLAEHDFSIDDSGNVTTDDGTVVPPSAFSNPSSLANSGFSESQIEETKDALKEARKAAANFKMKKASGDGVGGGNGKKFSAPNLDLSDIDASLFAVKKDSNTLNNQLKGSRYAGFNRSLAGDRIGVAGDNLFDMIRRRYEAKVRARHFLP